MRAGFVVDASVVAAWCFDDEPCRQAEGVLQHLQVEAAVVPSLFWLEIANALVIAERKKRVTRVSGERALAFVRELPILTDDEPVADRIPATVALAREYGLTAYDAAYLELAVRLALPLATLDEPLSNAARRAGLPAAGQAPST